MKHLFIVNPTAGGRDHSDEIRSQVENSFSRRSSEDNYEIYLTKAPLDAINKIKQEAALADHLRVYSCGGDGTFNECASGAAELSNVAVCPFPTGTGNDFCRMFGNEQSAFKNLEALIDGWETPIDIISCNGRYSANICSVGIDARIGTSVHKYSGIPIIGGAGGYVISAIVNMFQGISRNMRIRSGEFYTEGRHTLVCACNGRFYGGGFNPVPDAMPNDGIMDILICKKVSIFTFAALIYKYSKGRADEFTRYITHLRTDELEIEFDEDNVVNLDGEALFTDKVHMKLIPKGLNLIVPVGMHFFDSVKPVEKDKTAVI